MTSIYNACFPPTSTGHEFGSLRVLRASMNAKLPMHLARYLGRRDERIAGLRPIILSTEN